MTNNNDNYNRKKVGFNIYFHKSNTKALYAQPYSFQTACQKAMNWMVLHDHSFEVVKYNLKEERFSLISVTEWNELYEPIIHKVYNFDEEGVIVRIIPNDRQVYHMKHLFVDDDYRDFNIEESKKRTETIEALSKIKDTRGIKLKIGALDFWHDFMEHNDLPEYMEGCEGNSEAFKDSYTLHGVFLEAIPNMNKLVEKQEFDFFNRLKHVLEEFDMLRKWSYEQTTTHDMNVVNRIMAKMMMFHHNKCCDMFMTLYKPWNGKPWSIAENFLTVDDKFMVRKFNNYWYCLPIIHMDDIGIVTTKLPEEFSWEDKPKAYHTQLECMIGHFMERVRMFNLTPEQNSYFKNK